MHPADLAWDPSGGAFGIKLKLRYASQEALDHCDGFDLGQMST